MKRLISLLIIAIFLHACSSIPVQEEHSSSASATPNQSFTVIDALGRQVTFTQPPSRIVITGKGMIFTLNAVFMFPEAHDRVAALGVANQGSGNFIPLIDPLFSKKVILQGDAGAEQIAAVQPDLVILKSYLAETMGPTIEALKIPIVYVDFETPEQYSRDLMILGKVFQNEPRAQELSDFYAKKVNDIQMQLKDRTIQPRVLMLFYNDKDGVVAFNVPPMSWMQSKMVDLAGGQPVWASANPGKGWAAVTVEQIAVWDPDHIFIISYEKNSAEIAQKLKNDPQWRLLRAVKENHLSGFPADMYSWDQADARWILGLSWMAARLHPDIFPKQDIIKETFEFYEQMYRVDTELFESKIRPTFRGDLP